jgi:hypothetical protein
MKEPPDPGGHSGDDQTPIGDPPSKRGPKRLLAHEADRPDPPYGKQGAQFLRELIVTASEAERRRGFAPHPDPLPATGRGELQWLFGRKEFVGSEIFRVRSSRRWIISQSASKIGVLKVLASSITSFFKE